MGNRPALVGVVPFCGKPSVSHSLIISRSGGVVGNRPAKSETPVAIRDDPAQKTRIPRDQVAVRRNFEMNAARRQKGLGIGQKCFFYDADASLKACLPF